MQRPIRERDGKRITGTLGILLRILDWSRCNTSCFNQKSYRQAITTIGSGWYFYSSWWPSVWQPGRLFLALLWHIVLSDRNDGSVGPRVTIHFCVVTKGTERNRKCTWENTGSSLSLPALLLAWFSWVADWMCIHHYLRVHPQSGRGGGQEVRPGYTTLKLPLVIDFLQQDAIS